MMQKFDPYTRIIVTNDATLRSCIGRGSVGHLTGRSDADYSDYVDNGPGIYEVTFDAEDAVPVEGHRWPLDQSRITQWIFGYAFKLAPYEEDGEVL